MRLSKGYAFRGLLAVVVAAFVLVGTHDARPLPPSAPFRNEAAPASQEDAEAMRSLAFAYWAAFSSYDVERTLSYLEEGYKREREDIIRREIGQIRLFRVKLEVSEESPPQIVGPGEGEMYLRMKTVVDIRRIRMAFHQVDGQWEITYAQEVR